MVTLIILLINVWKLYNYDFLITFFFNWRRI